MIIFDFRPYSSFTGADLRTRLDRKKSIDGGHVQNAVHENRRAVGFALAQVALDDVVLFGLFLLCREDADVAVFVGDVDLAVDVQRRAPHGGFHVVVPVDLAGLGIEAVEEAGEVGDEAQAFGRDAGGGDRAVHVLAAIDLAVFVQVELVEVPDDLGIGVGLALAAGTFDVGIVDQFLRRPWAWGVGIGFELGADVALAW